MNAEAVLKQRVRNEQTSGEKKSPSKGVLIFYFFQPRCKFPGQSDKLLAAGAKGLTAFQLSFNSFLPHTPTAFQPSTLHHFSSLSIHS
jgi:hypothetical protein